MIIKKGRNLCIICCRTHGENDQQLYLKRKYNTLLTSVLRAKMGMIQTIIFPDVMLLSFIEYYTQR